MAPVVPVLEPRAEHACIVRVLTVVLVSVVFGRVDLQLCDLVSAGGAMRLAVMLTYAMGRNAIIIVTSQKQKATRANGQDSDVGDDRSVD